MKLNRKLIVGFIVFLLVAWIGNFIYYEKHVLRKPIFIKCYYEIEKGMDSFNIYFLQDIESKDKVVSVVFPELGKAYIPFSEFDYNSDRRYYNLKNISVNIGDLDSNGYKDKVVTKAIIKFSNGKSMNVNLGKIYFLNDGQVLKGLKEMDSSQGSDSFGNANGRYEFIANEDINIIGINSRLKKDVKGLLKISIAGKKISDRDLPVKIKAGDDFDISYEFNFNKNDIRRYNAYYFNFYVLTEDLSGNKGSISCEVNTNPQATEDFDINAIKK